MLRRMFMGAAAASAVAGLARAQGRPSTELTFGRATEHSAIDPHFSQTGPNNATASGIFERLVAFTAANQLQPSLAVSWKTLDPLTWEIKLRPGVTFHDGTPFTANDVAYSLDRVRHINRSPAPFTHAVSNVAAAEVVDALTLHVRTPAPTPLLMEQIGLIFIVPAKLGAGVGNDEFNNGKAAIGTGPYRFESWVPNDRATMSANAKWWGGKPDWQRVTLRFIPNNAARLAALLTGEVDLIDSVPPTDAAKLDHNDQVKVFSRATNRIIYLALDTARDDTPFVTGRDGQALPHNPLRDVRVRQAMSEMINRDVIASRLLSGAAVPAGQIVPQGEGGYTAALAPSPLDLKHAKDLLEQAGYPQGFRVTLHSSADRYPGDAQVAQAAGQMFARGGLQVAGVEALPYNVFAPGATDRKYSVFLFGWSSSTGDSSEALRSILATYDPVNGLGALNRTRYSNANFDALLAQASAEFDEAKRNALLADATAVAMHDYAVLPLYWQKAIWAARPGVRFEANESEDSSVLFAHPAGGT
ncbi:ABC transporter substrate-binding protein [Acidisphaera sp. L21]|uniref:ABC transporter substrate-binding protein n=1 Tax=Acidisphaera sp. L21 TaxID=1641851 RepID=UPI001C203C31|nr:ABC transporter substrate-binding protein [Acidisphaera sp. L21]